MRPAGSKEYVIPRGFLFDYVTCANYTTEIFGWIAFTLATRTLAAGIFGACGALQMGQWAIQKHARLRKVSTVHAIAPVLFNLIFKDPVWGIILPLEVRVS